MHMLWNLTGDLVSANEDEGTAEDDYLEFDKGKGKHPRLVCKGAEDLRHLCNIHC